MSHMLGKRTLLLVRHGQATHNVLINKSKCPELPSESCLEVRAKGYSLLDPGLTDTGKQQAEELKTHMYTRDIDILISSPLKRALQTAELGFGCDNIPRLVVFHKIRERDGGFGRLCDSGCPKKDAKQFTSNTWDWSLVPDHYSRRDIALEKGEESPFDPDFICASDIKSGMVNAFRETEEEQDERAERFLSFLQTLPETAKIAAMGHGDFWSAVAKRLFGDRIRLGNCGYMYITSTDINIHHGAR